MPEDATPAERFERRLRGHASAAALRARVIDAERETITKALDVLSTDDSIIRIASRIAGARRRIIVGAGRSRAAAAQLEQDLSRVVSGVRGVALEDDAVFALSDVRDSDVLIAYSFRRYRAITVDFATVFRERGGSVVALTDDPAAPITRSADEFLVVPAISASSFDSPSGVSVATHLLTALVAASAKGAGRRLARLEGDSYGLIRFSDSRKEAE